MKATIAPRGIHLVLLLALEPIDIEQMSAGTDGVIFLPLLGQTESCTAIALMSVTTYDTTLATLRKHGTPHIELETERHERVPDGASRTQEDCVREALIDDVTCVLRADRGMDEATARKTATEVVDAATQTAEQVKQALAGHADGDGHSELVERVLAASRG